jgi:hypothetical protein
MVTGIVAHIYHTVMQLVNQNSCISVKDTLKDYSLLKVFFNKTRQNNCDLLISVKLDINESNI